MVTKGARRDRVGRAGRHVGRSIAHVLGLQRHVATPLYWLGKDSKRAGLVGQPVIRAAGARRSVAVPLRRICIFTPPAELPADNESLSDELLGRGFPEHHGTFASVPPLQASVSASGLSESAQNAFATLLTFLRAVEQRPIVNDRGRLSAPLALWHALMAAASCSGLPSQAKALFPQIARRRFTPC